MRVMLKCSSIFDDRESGRVAHTHNSQRLAPPQGSQRRIMKFYLIVASGKKRGMPIAVKVDLFTLGSDSVCQLRSKLPGIGPQHCALVTRENKVFVRDLDSGAETFVNGDPIPPGAEC